MKQSLILLHGALGSKAQFTNLMPLLDQHRVHALDFSGHGERSMDGKPFGMGTFTSDILEFMDRHGLEQADFFGYSMGGYVALCLAEAAPERVGRICTLATKFHWTPESAAKETRMLVPDKMVEKVPAYAARLEKTHTGAGWQTVVEETARMMVSLGENPPLTFETLAKIRHPVRVSVGDQDRMVSLDETLGAYQALPNAQLQVLPGTPHPLDRISPHRLLSVFEDFFETNYAIAIRDIQMDDLPTFFANQQNQEALYMAAFTSPEPANHAAFKAHWERITHDPNIIIKTVLYRGEVAGHLLRHSAFGEPEVGYWMGKSYWSKGITTAALRLFLEQLEERPLYARVVKDNNPSRRVLEKCGFTWHDECVGYAHARKMNVEEFILKLE